MKKYFVLSGLLFAFLPSIGQKSTSTSDALVAKTNWTWELGIPLVTRNNSLFRNYNFQDSPNTEFLNGVFVRATKKSFALRLSMKYNAYSAESPPCIGCNDYLYVTETNKLFQIETGAQFSLLPKSSLLYVYTDVYYQNLFSKGNESGGFAGVYNSFTETCNGIGLHTGVGSKIRVWKSLFISPDLGYSFLRSYTHGTSINLLTNTSATYRYVNMNGNVYGRIILSVGF
ncbi:MAG: hypothetical protein ACHQF2_00130 [Flavobacteriales bacterium]